MQTKVEDASGAISRLHLDTPSLGSMPVGADANVSHTVPHFYAKEWVSCCSPEIAPLASSTFDCTKGVNFVFCFKFKRGTLGGGANEFPVFTRGYCDREASVSKLGLLTDLPRLPGMPF